MKNNFFQQPQNTSFAGTLGNYHLVTTADGQWTVHSDYFAEDSHSKFGARNETLQCYIDGTQVTQRKNYLNIVEVGFGVGLAYELTLQALTAAHNTLPLHYIGLEIDPGLLSWSQENFMTTPGPYPQRQQLQEKEKNIFHCQQGPHQLTVLIGDARKTFRAYAQKNHLLAHCFYQDAFSLKKNPQLWTYQWFEELRQFAAADARLATFSSSMQVIRSLIKAGWQVQEGPSIGRKRGFTFAQKDGAMGKSILKRLENSPASYLSDHVE